MRRRVLAALLLLSLVHVAGNVAWLRADEGVQFTDAAFHYSQVVELRQAMLGGADELIALPDQNERQRYGVLWYFVAAAVSLGTGPEAGPLLIGLSLVLWPLLLGGAFLLGSELAPRGRGETAGILTACIAGSLPGLFNYSRVLVLDLPLTVAVLWAIALMLRLLRLEPGSRSWRRTAWGAAAASMLALGIKANAAAFLVGPLWIVCRPRLRALWASDRRLFLQRTAVALGLAALTTVWLLLGSRGPALIETFRGATWLGDGLHAAATGSLAEWPATWARAVWGHSWEAAYYTILQTFTPPLLGVSLAAYVFYFARRRGCEEPLARAQRDLLFWWLVIPGVGVIFGLRGLYDERYILPLLPQAAAIVAVSLIELKRPTLRRALVASVLTLGAATWLVVGFDRLPSARPLACATVPGWTATDRVGQDLWLCAAYPDYWFMDRTTAPEHGDWPLDELEARLQPERERLGRPLQAVFMDELYDLFYRAFQRDLHRQDLLRHEDLLLVTRCWDKAWIEGMHGSPERLAETVRAADVVVVRWGSPRDTADQAVRGRRCIVPWNQDGLFVRRGELAIGDGTRLRYFTRSQGAGTSSP